MQQGLIKLNHILCRINHRLTPIGEVMKSNYGLVAKGFEIKKQKHNKTTK